jgi:hypothetical protein
VAQIMASMNAEALADVAAADAALLELEGLQ